jgi:hypothetical protein
MSKVDETSVGRSQHISDTPSELSNEALTCRVDRHAWPINSQDYWRVTVGRRKGTIVSADRTMVCERCGCRRTEVRTFGEGTQRQYKYPGGYLLRGGHKTSQEEYLYLMFQREGIV